MIYAILLIALGLTGCPVGADRVRRGVETVAHLSDKLKEDPSDEKALGQLIAFAAGEGVSRIVRTNAVAQLGVVGEAHPSELAPSAVPVLAKLVRSPDLFIRREAAQSLGSFAGYAASAVDDLLWVLEDTQEIDAKHFAAEALGRIAAKPEATVPGLVTFISTASYYSPAGVVALGAIGATARELLARELAGEDESRRAAAIWAFAEMGESTEEVEKLAPELLENPSPAVRWMAVRTAAELLDHGKASENLRRQLLAAMNDPDERVRTEAQTVLREGQR